MWDENWQGLQLSQKGILIYTIKFALPVLTTEPFESNVSWKSWLDPCENLVSRIESRIETCFTQN